MPTFHRSHRWVGLAFACTSLVYGGSGRAISQQKRPPPAAPSFGKDVQPVITEHCLPCHSGENPKAGLSLTGYKTAESIKNASAIWERVAQNISSGHMPPAGFPAPTKAQRQKVVAWLQSTLAGDCGIKDPGRVTMRRLNRNEYDNTIRDLTGLDLNLSEAFPSDDVGYGFDNIGDVLTISPLLMEKYLAAAEKAAKRAVVVPEPKTTRYASTEMRQASGGGPSDDGQIFFAAGTASVPHTFPGAGRYKIRVRASGQQAGPEPVKMAVWIADQKIGEVEVPVAQDKPKVYEFDVDLKAGRQAVGVQFLNDFYQPGPPPQDRNLYVQWVEILTPAMPYENLPDHHRKIVFLKPSAENQRVVARQVLSRFATRAFRRPVQPAELDRLVQIVDLVQKDKQSFERGLQLAVQAVLSSPHFLFRVEKESADGKLSGYELASRLSYFLWSSAPDDRLLDLAGKGKLSDPNVLTMEAKRMLADPKAASLGEDFAAQWLNLRKLANSQPDPKQFPEFKESLRASMLRETKMFFDGVVKEDRSVLDFLGGKYTYLNAELAKHYGIPNVEGDQFRKVSLVGVPRAGLLTHASVLTLTSNPTRTSPVKRGKWVLDQLLNEPPPPPPPNVPDLKEHDKITGATLRQRMEQHRKDPACASCHVRMDPIGFSLENFDATGKWRTEDEGAKIDNSGVLPDGTKFAGADQLRTILLKEKKKFVHALSDKMLTFALGRGLEPSDRCYVDEVALHVEKQEYRFSSLVAAVVRSEPFRTKRPVKGAAK
ncbi:MAG: DUF1592 domain-containing protein [Fimbriimonas sp.]